MQGINVNLKLKFAIE